MLHLLSSFLALLIVTWDANVSSETMSLMFAIFYPILRGVQALPIATPDGEAVAFSVRPARTKSGIIWSCLVTIFSCTWIAVHPNIPSPEMTQCTNLLYRVRLMGIALIMPEVVIIWAMRQWVAAYKLGYKHRDCVFIFLRIEACCEANGVLSLAHKWTQAHGYFAIMGGFMVYKEDTQCTVSPTHLNKLLRDAKIDITEREIRDKGRGDALSKTLVLVQTAWFILQCIARRIARLPITELELVTLAFAALNFVTYAVWWNKPLNVECPMRVYEEQKGEDEIIAEIGEGNEPTFWSIIVEDICAVIHNMKDTTISIKPSFMNEASGDIRRKLQAYIRNHRWHIIYRPLVVPVERMFKLFDRMTGSSDEDKVLETQVTTFYAGELTKAEGLLPGLAGVVIAIIFGSIHCIAWSFKFPTYTEKLLWRISSLTITCLPVVTLVVGIVAALVSTRVQEDTIFKPGVPVRIFLVTYIIGRLVLLLLPFMSLRSLPPEAYQSVQWTSLIPHV